MQKEFPCGVTKLRIPDVANITQALCLLLRARRQSLQGISGTIPERFL
jgi:hypothetical protein